jgi:integrase
LAARREPYWTVVSKGCAIGYRKGAKLGTWVARLRDEAGKQHYEALGAADDARDADGLTVFSFAQAQERARRFFTVKGRELSGDYVPDEGPLTVEKALESYFAERERKGSKGVDKDRAAARVRIVPQLGALEISKLSTKRLRDWQGELAKTSKGSDAEAARARKASANRTLTVLKAALNHAYHEGRVPSDEAWRKVQPFREANAAVIQYLSSDEARRLVNACEGEFRDLVRAALLTGCRYGELIRMRTSDYNGDAATVTVRESKAGRPRHVVLTDEGAALFKTLTAGKTGRELIFLRDDGRPWGASHQQRPLAVACARAKIEPAATFHVLRHSYASALAMRGAPMGVIAAQLGHADTRMTEKHYAHLAPSYVADTVRAALPALGIVESSNIAPLRRTISPSAS